MGSSFQPLPQTSDERHQLKHHFLLRFFFFYFFSITYLKSKIKDFFQKNVIVFSLILYNSFIHYKEYHNLTDFTIFQKDEHENEMAEWMSNLNEACSSK